ncbi:MAG TPA: DUF502 domain-containing protein [Patescibacteria group bacterium]|nr:DUF502 domain-containing protein [Patescibacteria group bacterium]
MGWFKRKILTGLVIILPTVVTGYVFYWLFVSIDSILKPLLVKYPFIDFPGFGFVSVVLVILLVGVFAGNIIGRQIIEGLESLVRRIPLINRMYIGIKQISEVFLRHERTVFREAILIQYPRPGIYVIGFVTSAWKVRGADGEERSLINVFLPTTPNPTSGLFLMVPREETIPLECSPDDALKMVISGGAFIPFIKHIDIPDNRSGKGADGYPRV